MDLSSFLQDQLSTVVEKGEALRVESRQEGRKLFLTIHAHPKDRGRIIGRQGRLIQSLRTLCVTAGEKAGLQVSVEMDES